MTQTLCVYNAMAQLWSVLVPLTCPLFSCLPLFSSRMKWSTVTVEYIHTLASVSSIPPEIFERCSLLLLHRMLLAIEQTHTNSWIQTITYLLTKSYAYRACVESAIDDMRHFYFFAIAVEHYSTIGICRHYIRTDRDTCEPSWSVLTHMETVSLNHTNTNAQAFCGIPWIHVEIVYVSCSRLCIRLSAWGNGSAQWVRESLFPCW